MRHIRHSPLLQLHLLLLLLLLLLPLLLPVCLTGCFFSRSRADHTVSGDTDEDARSNVSVCLVPQADGLCVYQNALATVDASHTSEGYVMVKYTGGSSETKMRLLGPDQVTYTYDLGSNKFEAFPLSAGDGSYSVSVYERVSQNSYSSAFFATFNVSVTNTYGPYLYPNQYVNFSETSAVVAEASKLAANAKSDLDVVANVYNYVVGHVTYDDAKAAGVQSGYLPDPDDTLAACKGICLDFAALMCAMLRSQRVPTRLEVGYSGDVYHAWVSVHVPDIGWINGIIEFDGRQWRLMDPTFAAGSTDEELEQYIGDGENYKVKYIY